MTTRLEAVQDIQMLDKQEVGLLLGQTFGTRWGSQFDLAAETRTLMIGDTGASEAGGEDPGIEVEGYYLGAQYRSPFAGTGGGVLRSYFAGAGLGAYGDYVKHADAHAGGSVGYDGRFFSPFAAAAAGFSLPYARKVFDHTHVTFLGYGPERRYRYASTIWLGYELGLESPFGNREKGFRLHMSMGNKVFGMLERDVVSDSAGLVSPYGVEYAFKLGLAWTY